MPAATARARSALAPSAATCAGTTGADPIARWERGHRSAASRTSVVTTARGILMADRSATTDRGEDVLGWASVRECPRREATFSACANLRYISHADNMQRGNLPLATEER